MILDELENIWRHFPGGTGENQKPFILESRYHSFLGTLKIEAAD
jgi:hypothetical protein